MYETNNSRCPKFGYRSHLNRAPQQLQRCFLTSPSVVSTPVFAWSDERLQSCTLQMRERERGTLENGWNRGLRRLQRQRSKADSKRRCGAWLCYGTAVCGWMQQPFSIARWCSRTLASDARGIAQARRCKLWGDGEQLQSEFSLDGSFPDACDGSDQWLQALRERFLRSACLLQPQQSLG
eukprot:g7380.t1